MLLGNSFISEHEGAPGFVRMSNQSRASAGSTAQHCSSLFPQLLARLEARRCLKDIEARLFPGDGGPEHGEQLSASMFLHHTLLFRHSVVDLKLLCCVLTCQVRWWSCTAQRAQVSSAAAHCTSSDTLPVNLTCVCLCRSR